MSKAGDIAAKLRATRVRFDAQLDDLDKEVDAAASDSDEVVRHHRATVAEIRTGIDDMRKGIREMEGNGGEEKIATFPSKALGTG